MVSNSGDTGPRVGGGIFSKHQTSNHLALSILDPTSLRYIFVVMLQELKTIVNNIQKHPRVQTERKHKSHSFSMRAHFNPQSFSHLLEGPAPSPAIQLKLKFSSRRAWNWSEDNCNKHYLLSEPDSLLMQTEIRKQWWNPIYKLYQEALIQSFPI